MATTLKIRRTSRVAAGVRPPRDPLWIGVRSALSLSLLAVLAVPAPAAAQTGVESARASQSSADASTLDSRRSGEHRSNALTLSLGLRETFTTNPNLEPTARSDWVTEIAPGFTANYTGAHSMLQGTMSIPVLIYARSGERNNYVAPTGNLNGDVSFFEDRFHIEGNLAASRKFLSPLGATPVDLSTTSDNSYRSTTLRLSPYVKGVSPGGIGYELRNNNVWALQSGSGTENSRFNELTGSLSSAERGQLGWRANFDVSTSHFSNQNPIDMRIARLVGVYRIDAALELNATVGYESNEYAFSSSKGATYGAGFRWRPTERTDLGATYEHRFFGSSYTVNFSHRTPRTVWGFDATRNVVTYPQFLGTLAGGMVVSSFLDQLFLSSTPDAAARQALVDRFMRDRGLPAVLDGPVSLYNQQIQLQERQSATFGIIGVRNTIVASVYNQRSDSIDASGSPLPAIGVGTANTTQTGANIAWTLLVTPTATLVSSIDGSRSVSNDERALSTKQGAARLVLTTPLSSRTTAFFGARYQYGNSDWIQNYREYAAYAGLSYTLR
jgi:uncharacterized protein (PEP-CTERM system associated)